jgi:single-strand DNA-binding protein
VTAVLSGTGAEDAARAAVHSCPAAARAAVLTVPKPSGERVHAAGMDRECAHRNEVTVVGRLWGPVQQRALASGVVLCRFRVVVRRERATGGTSVDALDCVVPGPGAVQRAVCRWSAGDLVEVRGALRRRCWRGVSGGVASRCEIEVEVARRLATAAALRVAATGLPPGRDSASCAGLPDAACVYGGGDPPPDETGPVTRRPLGQLAPPGGSPTAVSPAPELSGCPTGRGRKEVLTQV